jgi:hypothetical protein
MTVSGVLRPFFRGWRERAGELEGEGFELSLWTKLATARRVVSGGLSC